MIKGGYHQRTGASSALCDLHVVYSCVHDVCLYVLDDEYHFLELETKLSKLLPKQSKAWRSQKQVSITGVIASPLTRHCMT